MKTDRLTIGLPYDRRQWHDRDLGKTSTAATGTTSSAAMLLTSTLTDLAQARLLHHRQPPSPALMSYERRGLHSLGSSSNNSSSNNSSHNSDADHTLGDGLDAVCASHPGSHCTGKSLELSGAMYDDTENQTPHMKLRTPRLMPVLSDSSFNFQLNQVCSSYTHTYI